MYGCQMFLKYLYLLFDEENPLHSDDSNYVFSTEGHILTLNRNQMKPPSPARKKLRTIDAHQCPAYTPFVAVYDNYKKTSGLIQGIRARPEVDYARYLVGNKASEVDKAYWSPYGWCEKPKSELYVCCIFYYADCF